MRISTKEDCLKILEQNEVLQNIVAHLNAVHDFSMKVCDVVEKRFIKVNRQIVASAALLHDAYKIKSQNHEIVFYSDKRCKGDKVVTVDERFEDIKQRYFGFSKDLNKSNKSKILQTAKDSSKNTNNLQYKKDIIKSELHFTKKIEKDLLQGGII